MDAQSSVCAVWHQERVVKSQPAQADWRVNDGLLGQGKDAGFIG